jgi:hypothetical protein
MQFEPVRDPPSGVYGQPVSPHRYALRSVSWHSCVSYRIECTKPLTTLDTFGLLLGCRKPQSTGFLAQRRSMP